MKLTPEDLVEILDLVPEADKERVWAIYYRAAFR